MLSVYTALSSYAVKKYFSTADYYAGESVGFWGGKLAPDLGLEGKVTRDAFGQLSDNINPKTGKRLTLRMNDKRRVGEDMVFSLPKEFGAFIMLLPAAERDALLAVAEHNVREVMGVIEGDIQTRVRKDGKDETRPGVGLAYAGFFHPTARPVDGQPGDPHPHWHMFCFNATRDAEEGSRIKAAEFGKIYQNRAYYLAMFFSKAAAEFKRLGLPVVRRPDGSFGLAGLESFIATFSKRTNGIEDVARELNITDPAAKSKLGGKTRKKKDKSPLPPDQLQDNWLRQLTDGQRDALARVRAGLVAGDDDVTAAEAVEFAIAHCSEKQSVIPERELKRKAMLFSLGSVTPEEIDRELLSPRHGLIAAGDVDGRRCVTTEALREQERSIARYAREGLGKVAPVGVPAGLTRTLADGKRLSDDQYQAVTDLLSSPNRVNLLQGPAGAGKSSLLAKYDEGLRLAGQHVTYLGTTGAAVGVLEKDGFDAGTVASFIRNDKLQAAARGGRVVVDESSILCHKDALKLIEVGKENNLKFVFVGDPMQHGSIGRGAFMRLLTEHGSILPFRLTRILRQKDADYRAAAQLLSEGKPMQGFDALDKMGWVREIRDAGDRDSHMAADYVQSRQCGMAWNDILVVCPTHAEAARVTQSIRSQLRDGGTLTGDEHEFTRLVAVDTSEAERGQAMTYRTGEVIQFHRKAGGFAAGDRLVITDPAEVPLSEAGKFSLYRQETIGLAVGDVIRFTAKVKTRGGQHEIRNGEAHVVAGFTEGGNIRLENGWLVGKDAGHFRHGYVETSIGSQGRTVRRVLIDMTAAMGKAINMQQLYVSASRAWDSLLVYCDDKPAVSDAARRDSRQMLALDVKPEAPAVDSLDDDAERQRRLARQLRPFIYLSDSTRRQTPPPPPAPPAIPTHGARVLARLRQQGHAYGR